VSTRSAKEKRSEILATSFWKKERQVCQFLVIFRHKNKINDTNNTRVVHKVRKTQHQNPEFGHTHGEIFLKTCQRSTLAFTAPNCTTTIISLEPCALNAEFQHFILRF
jgi:hypothetical protein